MIMNTLWRRSDGYKFKGGSHIQHGNVSFLAPIKKLVCDSARRSHLNGQDPEWLNGVIEAGPLQSGEVQNGAVFAVDCLLESIDVDAHLIVLR